MDTPRITRVLVLAVAAVMVLSVVTVFFQATPDNRDQSSASLALMNGNDEALATPGAIGDPVAVQTYTVTFQSIGLPYGTPWAVTVDGNNTVSGTGTSISFQLANSTHTYSISKPTNYLASPESGVVFVYGSPVVQYITFELLVYSVTFLQTGLPSGSAWSVDLAGQTMSTTTDKIIFSMQNGSYSYSITGPDNYASDPSSGKVVVYGSNVSVDAAFATTLHRITFNFNGDVSGTTWTLSLGGESYSVSASSLTLVRNDGMYDYSATPATEYTITPSTGSVLVLGNDVQVNMTVQQNTYMVAFEHKGMTAGTEWKVTVGGVTHNSTTSVIEFQLPLGNYTYTISDVNGYTVENKTASVAVSGTDQVVSVNFSQNPDVWRMPLLILAGTAIGIAAGVGIGYYYVRRRKK